MIELKDGISFDMDNTNWENNIETGGTGKAKDIELLLQKKEGRTSGWISYTLSRNVRKFDKINSGNCYPYKYDQRHNIAIVLTHNLTKNISCSTTWIFSSGSLMTMPTAKYKIPVVNYEENQPDNFGKPWHYSTIDDLNEVRYKTAYYYGSKINFRLPAYHRLDLSISFTKQKQYGVRTWQIGIYNVYNRHNAYYVYYENNDLYQFSLFPIVPSVSYSYRF